MGKGTAVDVPPPPALPRALLAPPGRAGDGWVIEWKEWGLGQNQLVGRRGRGGRQALGNPFPWPLETVRLGPGRGMSDSGAEAPPPTTLVCTSNSAFKICWGQRSGSLVLGGGQGHPGKEPTFGGRYNGADRGEAG